MITIILEAALRSFVLGALVWLVLKALWIKHPQLERNAWRIVLVAALAMPWLMQLELFSTAATSALSWYPYVQLVAITAANTGPSWMEIAADIYVAVAGMLVARQVFGLFKAWRLRRASVSLDPIDRVRASELVRSPVTVFSTIIVPANFQTWSMEEQRAALAHEAAHVANLDFYLQQFAHLHRNLFWCNPFAWWLARRLSILSEHISDDAALRTMTERATYAEFLLSFAKCTSHDEHAIAMARPTTLIQRIERILNDRANPPAPRLVRKGAALTSLLLLVVASAGISTSIANEVSPAAKSPASNATSGPNGEASGLRASKLAAGIVLPKSNPARPLSQPVYPPPSRRLLESGTVVLRLHVLPNGRVSDAVIEKSSGFIELDNAARYESFRWQLDPGTVKGTPSPMWGQFAVTFKLNNNNNNNNT